MIKTVMPKSQLPFTLPIAISDPLGLCDELSLRNKQSEVAASKTSHNVKGEAQQDIRWAAATVEEEQCRKVAGGMDAGFPPGTMGPQWSRSAPPRIGREASPAVDPIIRNSQEELYLSEGCRPSPLGHSSLAYSAK